MLNFLKRNKNNNVAETATTEAKNTTNSNYKEKRARMESAWKDFHAQNNHKKVVYIDGYGGCTKTSKLTCIHHVIYAVMRSKDVSKLFTPLTDKKAIPQGKEPYHAFKHARAALKFRAKYGKEYRDELLLPFGDALTIEDIEYVIAQLENIEL